MQGAMRRFVLFTAASAAAIERRETAKKHGLKSCHADDLKCIAEAMRAELGSAYCSVGEVSKSGGWCLTGQWPGKFHAPMSDSAASAVASLVSGSAVLDLGCGTGAFGHWLSTRGRQYAVTYMGYDGAENVEQYTRQARHQLDKNIPIVHYADLTTVVSTLPMADWVFSTEVGEHIPSQFSASYIANLHMHNTKGIIMSWALATPWQGGTAHINNRDPSEIQGVLTELGYTLDLQASTVLRHASRGSWLEYSFMVFRKSKEASSLPRYFDSLRQANRTIHNVCKSSRAMPTFAWSKLFKSRCLSATEDPTTDDRGVPPDVAAAVAKHFKPPLCNTAECLRGREKPKDAIICCSPTFAAIWPDHIDRCSYDYCDPSNSKFISWCGMPEGHCNRALRPDRNMASFAQKESIQVVRDSFTRKR